MPEPSRDNFKPEQDSALEQTGLPLVSSSIDEFDSEYNPSQEQPAATQTNAQQGNQLREAVFTEAKTASDSETTPDKETVSFWQKLKHSALYGNKQKAAATSSNRHSRRQNKTGLLIGGALTALVAGVWLLYLVSAPVRRPPAPDRAAEASTPAQTAPEKSLTPGLQAHPAPPSSSNDGSVTAADVRATASGTTPPTPSASKKQVRAEDPDYGLGKIPPLPPAPATAPATPAPVLATAQKNPLDTTSLVFVRHTPKDSSSASPVPIEPASYRSASALPSQAFHSLTTGTRLVARLETPVSTSVSLPAVATVEYNYEDRDHTVVIPAGSRVFGRLEQADSQGFVGLHFQSIQRPSDPAPLPFEARAIGLNYQPLRGVVTGRNRGRRLLVRAASGVGEMAAATVGLNRGTSAGDALNSNVLIREQLMNNLGSAGDQEIQRMAYSEHPVVTLPGNTRFYLVIDQEAKQGERREAPTQSVGDGNTSNASIQTQLLELRKELAEVTARQTLSTSPPAAAPASETVSPSSATSSQP